MEFGDEKNMTSRQQNSKGNYGYASFQNENVVSDHSWGREF
jgi:hypothetical protein